MDGKKLGPQASLSFPGKSSVFQPLLLSLHLLGCPMNPFAFWRRLFPWFHSSPWEWLVHAHWFVEQYSSAAVAASVASAAPAASAASAASVASAALAAYVASAAPAAAVASAALTVVGLSLYEDFVHHCLKPLHLLQILPIL